MRTDGLFRRTALLAGLALCLGAATVPTQAQSADAYPSHGIELVVPYGAGGGTDALARVFAEAMKKHFSQPITVINKPGASGAICFGEVAAAKPDGYKIGVLTLEMVILPHLGIGKYRTDDFTPIVRLNQDPVVLAVRADAPWNTVEEFVDAARKNSDGMKFGNAGIGGVSHLAALGLQQKLGTKFVHVPFQGNAPAVVALLGGHIDAVVPSPSEVIPHVNSGKVKLIAIMGEQRLKGFDNVPTLKERNIDLVIGTWRGLGAPKGLPPDVLAKLSDAAMKAANDPSVKEAMDKLGLGYSVADGARFKTEIDRDSNYFKNLITQLDLKLN